MQSFFDLHNYPIFSLDSKAGQALLSRCRVELRQSGALALPGFISTGILDSLIKEIVSFKSHSHHMQGEFTPYSDNLNEADDAELPNGHPRHYRLPASHRFLAGDLFSDNSLLKRIYADSYLQKFLSVVLDVPHLHAIDDPLGCVNSLFYEPGDCNGWHFDTTEFVTSIMLQAAERGGDYEYIPGLRSADNENLAAVANRMRNPDDDRGVKRVELQPGTLFLFKGKNTLHRVTSIQGQRDRIVAILSYHTEAGHTLSEGSKLAMYGRKN